MTDKPTITTAVDHLGWWRRARFGMFIHWSPVTSLNGYWKGNPTDFCSEWIRHTARIPRAEYMEVVRNFKPRHFDPAEWVAVARQAGMKYMVFTAKHHDGFSFWDSEHTDFKITNTAAKRDVMRELTDECRRQKMPLGWYYSPRDWHHPDYLPQYSRLSKPGAAYKGWWGYNTNSALGIDADLDCGCPACVADIPVAEDRDAKTADLSRYLKFMQGQLEELITRYGPTAQIWFDAQEHSPTVGGTAELIRFLRGLKPDLLINDRVATEPGWGDFAIHEWNIPQALQPRPWESCLCLNGSWSFNAFDLGWKPVAQLIRELCEIVSRGGNLLLNVGPDPDGVIPPVSVERLQEMGRWLAINGEAIYDTEAGAFAPTGALRFTRRGDTHYVISTEWPGNEMRLPMLRLNPEAEISLLGVGTLLHWANQPEGCIIRMPAVRPCLGVEDHWGEGDEYADMNDNTKWFADCGWGVFNHYLVQEMSPAKFATTADEWNRLIDNFDVKALATQVASTGAGYYFITLGQASGHYCAPNVTYDRYVGIAPSKCSQRDLISELYDALQPYGIALMAYVPADGSWADPVARAGMKMTTHWGDPGLDVDWGRMGPSWTRFRLPEYQRIWEEICRDWSLRFGKKVRGWWVDGCYAPQFRYPEDEEPNYCTFAAALRAGNPEAIVAFNTGVSVPVISATPHEDYTAGELTGDLPVGGFGLGDNPAWCNNGPIKPFVSNARFHVFNFLGPWWCASPPRFPTELVVGYTKYITQHGGVVTWDVPVSPTGLIPEPFLEQLRAISGKIKPKIL